jgi:hypothetical protein
LFPASWSILWCVSSAGAKWWFGMRKTSLPRAGPDGKWSRNKPPNIWMIAEFKPTGADGSALASAERLPRNRPPIEENRGYNPAQPARWDTIAAVFDLKEEILG